MSDVRYPYVHAVVAPEQAEHVGDQLWMLGATGLEERDGATLLQSPEGRVLLIASFESDDEAHRAVAELEVPARVQWVEGDEWRHKWREFFKPTKVGQRLWIRPSWEALEPGPDEVVLTIDPGGAFGSGIHETTQLVLAEVERRTAEGCRVADVGCGSGILSIAALLLGAGSADAIDVDADAARISVENADLKRGEESPEREHVAR